MQYLEFNNYEAKLAILLIKLDFSLFDVNAHCLIRQKVLLLSEKFKLEFFFNSMPGLFIQFVTKLHSRY
jgi:hypothetical protein